MKFLNLINQDFSKFFTPFHCPKLCLSSIYYKILKMNLSLGTIKGCCNMDLGQEMSPIPIRKWKKFGVFYFWLVDTRCQGFII